MPTPLDPMCLFETLSKHGVDYVLIGGLAAVLHGSTATTNDADIVPRNVPENLKRLSDALAALKAKIRTLDDPEGVPFDPHPALLSSIAMLNMTTECGDLDLTLTPAGLDNFEDLQAASIAFDVDGITVQVASLADIIHSKTVADRPKDRAALPILHALQEEIARSKS